MLPSESDRDKLEALWVFELFPFEADHVGPCSLQLLNATLNVTIKFRCCRPVKFSIVKEVTAKL